MLLQLPSARDNVVTFDNWYSSGGLVASLGLLGIPCRSTCRNDRTGGAPLMSNSYMKNQVRGTTSESCSPTFKIAALKWMHNSVVTMLSNCDKMVDADEVKRFDRSKNEHIFIKRKDAIKAYNIEMGGVDYLDRGCSEYRISIRSIPSQSCYLHHTKLLFLPILQNLQEGGWIF